MTDKPNDHIEIYHAMINQILPRLQAYVMGVDSDRANNTRMLIDELMRREKASPERMNSCIDTALRMGIDAVDKIDACVLGISRHVISYILLVKYFKEGNIDGVLSSATTFWRTQPLGIKYLDDDDDYPPPDVLPH